MMRGRLVALWTIPVAVLAVLITGCGAPQFTYVTNSGDHTYFKVPPSWHKIDPAALNKAINNGSSSSQAGVWTVGYDASAKPDASDVLSAQALQPFAYAVVGALSSTASSSLSYDQLRDFFLPVTSAARSNAAKSGFPLTGFQLLRNATLTPGEGVHGVRVTFDYTYPDGSIDTFDQVALTNADDTKVYLLLVHCTSTCYSKYTSQIDTVMTSFTVRSP